MIGLGLGITQLSCRGFTAAQRVVNDGLRVLRSFGQDAHIWLPGVGQVNGLTAGNWIDSAGTVPAVIDNPVGKVTDSFGGIHATQSLTGSKPILRRGILNLTPRSNTFTDALWFYPAGAATFVGSTDPTGALNSYRSTPGTVGNAPINTSANNNRTYSDQTFANGTYTIALWVKTDAIDSAVALYLEDRLSDTVRGSGSTTTNSTWQLIVATGTTAGASAGVRILWASTQAVLLGGVGLFAGTLTAQQIIAAGGIPLTTTAPASSSQGPSWFDTSGSKSINATFPAGNESVTVIDALPTGQATATGQNVVGTYNVASASGTRTSGKIIVSPSSALSAPDLLALQKYANLLAGVSI